MRGQKIQIADDPEINRHLRNTQVQSQAAYHHEGDKKRQMDETRPAHEIKGSTGGGMRPQATNNGESAILVDEEEDVVVYPIPVQIYK